VRISIAASRRARVGGIVSAVLLMTMAVGVIVVARSDRSDRSEPVSIPPPRVHVAPNVRVIVGETAAVPIAVEGSDDTPTVQVERPVDVTVRADALEFRATAPGTRTATITVTGPGGTTTARVNVRARHVPHPDLVVGAGDSIASGHGLERRDYLGQDACWRDFDDAYPRVVADALDATVAIVACSGARATSLATAPVPSERIGALISDPQDRSQLDWIAAANPGVVVMTAGANDLGFTEPADLFDGDALHHDTLDQRLDRINTAVSDAVTRILDETDARVVITGYHNPTAIEPVGIDGCAGRCFRANVDTVMSRLHATLREAVRSSDDGRVTFADPGPLFIGHEASTGLPLGGLRATTPYCAASGLPWDGDPWVNQVDCVHPNATGARAYADAVVRALR